jgi:hypothetical protein
VLSGSGRGERIQSDVDRINALLAALRDSPALLQAFKAELDNADAMYQLARNHEIDLDLPYIDARAAVTEAVLQDRIKSLRALDQVNQKKRVSDDVKALVRDLDRTLCDEFPVKTQRRKAIADRMSIGETTVREIVEGRRSRKARSLKNSQ